MIAAELPAALDERVDGRTSFSSVVSIARWLSGVMLVPPIERPAQSNEKPEVSSRPSVEATALFQPSPFSSSGSGRKARPTGVIIPVVAK
jgi:hypothetical protein